MSLSGKIHIIGHICHDKLVDKLILGGTASYASMMATQMFQQVFLTTSFGEDFLFLPTFTKKSIRVTNHLSAYTTVFENLYHDDQRTQYLHKKALDIQLDDLGFTHSNVLFFCPIANEIQGNIKPFKKEAVLLTATLQGWLRTFGDDGKVREVRPNLDCLDGLDIIIMSDDDIATFPDIIDELVAKIPIVVLTKGKYGTDIFHNHSISHTPSFDTNPIDLTGAGDIFAMAFIYAYSESLDLDYASSFAHSAASLSIEGVGIDSLPTINAIKVRQKVYQKRYLSYT